MEPRPPQLSFSPATSSVGGSGITYKYNPHQMKAADVLETFVGRDELRDRLLSHLRGQRGSAAPRHLFLYGPRGIGKTTLLLVLRHSIEASPGLRDTFDPVQFCEEERRVVNLPSFAIRTLELWSQARPAAEDDPVRERLARARQEPDQAFDLLLAAGGAIFAISGQQAVFLIDNLDDVLAATVSGKGRRFGGSSADLVSQLERFFTCPGFLVIGTALQNPEKRRELSPLLGLFEPPIRVEPLPDAMAFLRKRAERDRNQKFLARLSSFAPRIEGLDRLAEGNPRLLAFLYDCLGERPYLDLVEIVQRTVDDLTPMYQDILDRLLNRGQAATLEMLAVHGGVGRAKDIAELTYQDEQTVRTFLNDLRDLGLVVRHEDLQIPGAAAASSARETVFRVHPPLFQIWYEMRHLQREESLFLVHFFSLLTDAAEARRILDEARSWADGQAEEIGSLFESVVDILDAAWEDARTQHVDKVLAAGGTLHDALESLSRAIEVDRLAKRPPRIGLIIIRSQIHRSLGNLIAAEQDLIEAKDACQEGSALELRVKLHLARANHFLAVGRFAESRGEVDKAIAASAGLQSASAPEIRTFASLILANAHLAQGETERAQALAAEALDSVSGSLFLKFGSCALLGQIHQTKGELKAALSWFMQALETARAMGSLHREVSCLNRVGQLLLLLGEGTRARDFLERALTLARQIRSPKDEADSLNHLGGLNAALGDYVASREHYERALEIHHQLGDRRNEAGLLNNLGTVYSKTGDHRKAFEAYESLFTLSRENQDPPAQAVALINMGSLCNETKDPEHARVHFLAALEIVRQTGNMYQEAVLRNNLGNTLSALGSSEDATAHFQAALLLARTAGFKAVEVMCLNNLGSEFLERKNLAAAREYLTRGLSIAQAPEDSHARARLLANLASLDWQEDRKEEGISCLEQARAIFRDRGEPAGLRKSSQELANALFQLGAESSISPEPWLSQALSLIEDIGAEDFLASFLSFLALPCLRKSGRAAPQLLSLAQRLRDHSAFTDLASQISTIEAFFRFLAAGRSSAELKDLSPTELFLVRSLIDQIDRPLHAEARSLILRGRSAEARELLERILTRTPEDYEALFNLASLLAGQDDLGPAVDLLQRCLDLKPTESAAPLLLAKIEEKRGETERALEILRNAAGHEAAPPDVFRELARLLRSTGRYGDLTQTLRRWKGATNEPDDLQVLAVWILEAELLAGETDRARVALPPESFVPADPEARLLLGGLRVLFALVDGDAEAARRFAGTALRDAADLPPSDLPSPFRPELLARAREILGGRDFQFFSMFALAISQQLPPEQLDFLGEADLAEIKRLVAEEGALALQALRSGKIQSLSDLFRLGTRSLSPRAALAALGEAWPELAGAQQEVVFEMLLEALADRRAGEATAALGALGKTFARLSSGDRARGLSALVDLAEHPETEALVRDQTLGLLNVLYPHLASAERNEVRPRLEEIRSRIESPALSELFRETIPAVEREPTP